MGLYPQTNRLRPNYALEMGAPEKLWCVGFGVWGVGCGVWGAGFEVWVVVFGVQG